VVRDRRIFGCPQLSVNHPIKGTSVCTILEKHKLNLNLEEHLNQTLIFIFLFFESKATTLLPNCCHNGFKLAPSTQSTVTTLAVTIAISHNSEMCYASSLVRSSRKVLLVLAEWLGSFDAVPTSRTPLS
jgi:hypothetical protein